MPNWTTLKKAQQTKAASGDAPKKKREYVHIPRPTDLPEAIDALNAAHRPDGVPSSAVLLVAWVDLPSQNWQARQGSTHAQGAMINWRVWKTKLLEDFSHCLQAQFHPGVLEQPHVHIRSWVAQRGDESNSSTRHKFVIDCLQTGHDEVTTAGKKRHRGGYLGLFQNDSSLTHDSLTIEEFAAGETRKLERKVMVWVY